jgi:hypothetical protein
MDHMCKLCKQYFPDRKELDRHPCPAAEGGGRPRSMIRSTLTTFALLAIVSVGTWSFIVNRWAVDFLEIVAKEAQPTHVHIANGVAVALFVASWWRYVRLESRLAKGAIVLLALLVWAGSMPAVRAAIF